MGPSWAARVARRASAAARRCSRSATRAGGGGQRILGLAQPGGGRDALAGEGAFLLGRRGGAGRGLALGGEFGVARLLGLAQLLRRGRRRRRRGRQQQGEQAGAAAGTAQPVSSAPGHLRGLRQAHQVAAASARCRPAGRRAAALRGGAEQQHRHRVRRVRGVRPAGRGIAHHLAIAVIGGDEQRAARSARPPPRAGRGRRRPSPPP